MDALNWEFSVFSRAVAYKNLSGAAANVGLSQPQLSRIVQRLERELNIQLLDRSSKRTSGWHPIAYKLAETYAAHAKELERKIHSLSGVTETKHLRIGLLEGLISAVLPFAEQLMEKCQLSELDVSAHDLSRLEELFFKGDFDLIFTSHEPGKKKFHYWKTIGYQSLDPVQKSGSAWVMSNFEFAVNRQKIKREKPPQLIISNSLEWRRQWLEKFGGRGVLPSPLRKEASRAGAVPVLLIGADSLGDALWEKIEKIKVG